MIVEVKQHPRLAAWIKRAMPSYRKHKVIVSRVTSVTLDGGYWDDGSRSVWSQHGIDGNNLPALRYPTAPVQFGGGQPPQFTIPAGTIVADCGTFCGKQATLSLHGNPEDIDRLLAQG